MAQEATATVEIQPAGAQPNPPAATHATGGAKPRTVQPAATGQRQGTAQTRRTVRAPSGTTVNVNVGASAAASSSPVADSRPAAVPSAPQTVDVYAHFTQAEADRLNKFMGELNCDLDMQKQMAAVFVAMKHYVGRNGVVESIDLFERMPELSVQEVRDLGVVMAHQPGLMHQLSKIGDNALLQSTVDSVMDAASSMSLQEFDATAHLLGKLPPEAMKVTVEKLMHARFSMHAHGMNESDYISMCNQLAGAADSMVPGDKVQAVQAFIDARPYITTQTFGNMVGDVTDHDLLVKDEATLKVDVTRGRKDDKAIEDNYMKARADGHYKAGTMTVGPNGVFDYSTSNLWAQNVHYDAEGRPTATTTGGGTAFVSAVGSLLTGIGIATYGIGGMTGREATRVNETTNNTRVSGTGNTAVVGGGTATGGVNSSGNGAQIGGRGNTNQGYANVANGAGSSAVSGAGATMVGAGGIYTGAGGQTLRGQFTGTTVAGPNAQAAGPQGATGNARGGDFNSGGGNQQDGSSGASATSNNGTEYQVAAGGTNNLGTITATGQSGVGNAAAGDVASGQSSIVKGSGTAKAGDDLSGGSTKGPGATGAILGTQQNGANLGSVTRTNSPGNGP